MEGKLMTCQVRQVNKSNGIEYVYESVSYWDKEKQQSRNKRVCIGKIDPEHGAFVPSKRLTPKQASIKDLTITASASIIGPLLILDNITTKLGLDKLLKSCFPNDYRQIQMMAYYLVAHGGPLSHCGTWCKSHAPHLAESLTSQRISEIICNITIDEKQTFCTKWMNKILEDDYLCYDITSISSYSELNEYIKYGHNRDKEKLPQLNLAMLFGQKGRLPVYFHQLPGNITDVTTLTNLLKTFKFMGARPLNYVMDKGFYSKKNVDCLLDMKQKFTVSVPMNNKWVQEAIDDIYQEIHGPQGYQRIDTETLYVHSSLYSWGDKKRRCYLHLYYNAYARAVAVDKFSEALVEYKAELESGSLDKEHSNEYSEFFIIKTTPKRGIQVSYNNEAVSQYIKRYAGFQAILSSAIKDPVETLQIYRDKDVVEKCFDDLKNQLDMKRLRMHSSEAVNGRLFVQFIALIYISALRKDMRSTGLIKQYTTREMLQEMETLTKIKYSGKYGYILTELTKQQRDILKCLKIELLRKT
jgi:transposase